MEEKKTVVTSGCSLTTVLGVVFLVLKLVGVIDGLGYGFSRHSGFRLL